MNIPLTVFILTRGFSIQVVKSAHNSLAEAIEAATYNHLLTNKKYDINWRDRNGLTCGYASDGVNYEIHQFTINAEVNL